MPALADYQTFVFDQGAELRKTYAFNPQLQAGICYALMIDWIKDLMNHAAHTATERKTVLDNAFTLAAGRQRVYTAGRETASKGTGTMAYDKSTDLSSDLGRLYGMKFTYKEFGTAVDPFSTAVVKSDYQDKFLYLELSGSGWAHAIGLRGATTVQVFDPNLGEFGLSRSGTAVRDFSQLLWAQYTSWNLVITQWILREVEKQSTVFDFWKSKK